MRFSFLPAIAVFINSVSGLLLPEAKHGCGLAIASLWRNLRLCFPELNEDKVR